MRASWSLLALPSIAALAASSVLVHSERPARADGVPQFAAPWLPDIALARMNATGPVILVNPRRCAEVGASVCTFTVLHEVGHVTLRHFGGLYQTTFGGRQLAEIEADCFAARNARYVDYRATIDWFLAPAQRKQDDGFHGTGEERAARLRKCRAN